MRHSSTDQNSLIDLSHTVEDGLITYKGLPAPVICDFISREESRKHYSDDTEFHIGKIEMVANTGTYVDSPFHRYANGKDLSALPLSSLADLPVVVVRPSARRIDASQFDGVDVFGKAVLVDTGWSKNWNTAAYFEGHPFLTEDAALLLRARRATLVGIDSLNIDDTSDGRRPVHSTLLSAEIPIVEHMTNLAALPDAGSRFFAVPVKVKAFGTFPVRAFAKVENEKRIELPTLQGYDRWASIYDDEDNPLVILEHTHVQLLMSDCQGLRILDAGCGTGRHALFLARAGAKVTAVDFSAGMLARARAKPGAEQVEFVQHDLEMPLPQSDDQFDSVISGLVVDHSRDLATYFSELRRVCRPGGSILITVMHPALMLRGAQARFTDPQSGALTLPASQQHQVSDYVNAIRQARLTIKRLSEHMVDEALAAKSQRADRYLGWPMLLSFELTR